MSRYLIKLFASAIIILMVLAVFLVVDYQTFLKTPIVNETTTFTVQSGDTVQRLIQHFPENSINLAARSPFSKQLGSYYFCHLVKSSGQARLLKIGEYQLEKGTTPMELLDLLVSGKTKKYKITFVEGWRFQQIREVLAKDSNIKQTLTGIADDDVMDVLGLTDKHYEGQFFPETYQFDKNTKDVEILKRAYQLMQKRLDKAWQARDKNIALKSPYELLILASIIEKESSIDSERNQVSGVFHRRLSKSMPLQTDPTVIYGLRERYRGKIYRSDLKADGPYNTYTRKGLTPTPIAIPSMASLMAAGHPDQGKALYFVANGTGGHTFSVTYQEHRRAVKTYRQQQNKTN